MTKEEEDKRSEGQEFAAALAVEAMYEYLYKVPSRGKGYARMCRQIQDEMIALREEVRYLRREHTPDLVNPYLSEDECVINAEQMAEIKNFIREEGPSYVWIPADMMSFDPHSHDDED